MVTSRQVGAPNGSGKEHITHRSQAPLPLKEHHVARGMSRAMQDLEVHLAHMHGITILEPALWCEGATGKTHHASLFGQHVDPEAVSHMRPLDGDGQPLGQCCSPSGMVQMTMGDEDAFHHQLLGFDGLLDQGEITAWIHHGRAPGLAAPQYGTILLVGSNGDDRKSQHGSYPALANPWTMGCPQVEHLHDMRNDLRSFSYGSIMARVL
jgi:hypothetical protein